MIWLLFLIWRYQSKHSQEQPIAKDIEDQFFIRANQQQTYNNE